MTSLDKVKLAAGLAATGLAIATIGHFFKPALMPAAMVFGGLSIAVACWAWAQEFVVEWKQRSRVMYGEEGDACECGHLYCYHCDEDEDDSELYGSGCQVQGCACKNVWREER